MAFANSVWTNITLSARERSRTQAEERLLAAAPNEPQQMNSFQQFVESSPWYIKYPSDIIKTVGLTPDAVIGLAYETPTVVVKLLSCNIEAQMFCTHHYYSVFTAAVIAVIILTLTGALFSITSIPIVAMMLSLIGFSGIVMFIAFEYSPACAPLIPTCFFSSIVADIAYFFPTKIIIPQSLLACKHDQSESVPPVHCMISCSSEPFQFTDFTSNFAWIICGNSEKLCQSMEETLSSHNNWYASVFGLGMAKQFRTALYRSRTVLASQDANIISGFTWCHYLTIYQLIPLIVIIVFAVVGLPLTITAMVATLVGILRTSISAYALSHID